MKVKIYAAFYGQGFRDSALPDRDDIENVAKNVAKVDIFGSLKKATQGTNVGKYGKGQHSFKILAKLDPEKIKNKSPHAKRLIETLDAKTSA